MRLNRHITCSMCSAILKPLCVARVCVINFCVLSQIFLNTDPDAKKTSNNRCLFVEVFFKSGIFFIKWNESGICHDLNTNKIK